MDKKIAKIYVGFITYNEATAKYLPYFLPGLKAQTYKEIKILAVDNSESEINKNSEQIKNNYPEIRFKWAGANLGFAKAFNLMINEAISGGAKYFLALNPDMVLEPGLAERLVETMASEKNCGAVAPKILKWDFASNLKTRQIDSLGLSLTASQRFSDAHQGKTDKNGESRETKEIFGFTGAAVLLNLEALRDTAFDNAGYKEYFDELMFMYKEDCDLSYRLRLAGWRIILAPRAVAYHDRAVAPKGETDWQIALNRGNKSRQVKKWSFLNHWILLVKFKNLPFSPRVKLAAAWYQLKSLIYVLLFERYLLGEIIKLRLLLPKIKQKRERMPIRIDVKEIEKFMK